MKKWMVKASFVIQADTRGEAWGKASEIMERHFRSLIMINAVEMNPLSDPQEWIALNEPIKAKR